MHECANNLDCKVLVYQTEILYADAFLNRHVEGEVQTKMHQKEPDEKIDSVRNEIMRARQVYLNKCMETLVPNILTRTFVQKFSVNIFEEPAESVVNMDYSPTFHNLHFARLAIQL